MKVKKIALALAAVVGTTALAACGATNKKIAFLDYWKYNPNTAEPVNEVMEYGVTFEQGAGYQTLGYTMSYTNGKYVTTLTNADGDYVYTTHLTIDVTYQYGEDKAETFTDEVISSVRFSSGSMQPISSTKSVVSHSPSNGTVTKTAECYVEFQYEVATTYDGAGNGKAIVVNYKETETKNTQSTFEYGTGDYSYLDNEQLFLAMRAVSPSTTSGSVEIYNPYMKLTEKIDFSFAAKEDKTFSYNLNGEKQEKAIVYRTVTLSLDSVNPGGSHTAIIAATADNASQNTNRNVMLQMETPLSYNAGKLVYKLTSATFA